MREPPLASFPAEAYLVASATRGALTGSVVTAIAAWILQMVMFR